MKSILDSWLRVQASWMYLQQIFSSADIRRQMPFEGKTFLDVDKFWYSIPHPRPSTPAQTSITHIPFLNWCR